MKILHSCLLLCRRATPVVVLSIVCTAAAGDCFAQSNGVTTAPAQAVAAAHVTYEPGDLYLPGSRVYVFVGKTGFGHEHGIVGQLKQGHIDMGPGKNAGILDFNMTTFTADTPEARKFVRLEGATDASTQQQVNANMRGADVLDVGKFPASRFTIKEIVKLPQPGQSGLPQYRLNGDFTLHGVTRPIQVVAEAEDQQEWTRLRGGFTMLQSQFGITPFTKALGAVGVTDQLTVWGDLWIAKQRVVAARQPVQRQ
jgi:YceI-like domain